MNIELENCLKEAAEAEAERKALEEKLKDITDSISNLTSEYIKSKDTLEQMEQYKDFITKLQDKDEEVEVRKNEMREEEKKEFLWQHEFNDNDEDDQIMFSFNKTTQVLERLKTKKECKETRKKMRKEDWEDMF